MLSSLLAELAAAHGRTIGAELEALLDDIAWSGIEAAYLRLSGDELERYGAEAETWARAGLDVLASSATHEYPEYDDIGR